MSDLGTVTVALLVVLVLLGPFLAQSRADASTEIYRISVGVGEIGKVRLHVNPSTGCSWWVESAPSSSVVDIAVSEDVDPTIDRDNPPRLGCSNQIVVYSFRAPVPGKHEIELRYGHAWAHSEYYEVAMVHLTVTGPPEPQGPLGPIIRAWNGFVDWVVCAILGRCSHQ